MPHLVINPRGDRTFADFVKRIALAGLTTPESLQTALRVEYPSVMVRARELFGEAEVVWYVYRDGHWTNAPS